MKRIELSTNRRRWILAGGVLVFCAIAWFARDPWLVLLPGWADQLLSFTTRWGQMIQTLADFLAILVLIAGGLTAWLGFRSKAPREPVERQKSLGENIDPKPQQSELERRVQDLMKSAFYFDKQESNRDDNHAEAIQSRYLAGRVYDIGGNPARALELYEEVRADASKTGLATVARNCYLAIANLECKECERDQTSKVTAGAMTVMSTSTML
jgi:hypothetical protein